MSLIAVLALAGIFLLAEILVRAVSSKNVFDPASADHLPRRNAALVLGCARTLPNGRKNRFFSARMEAAAELYRSRKVSVLIVSGDNHIRNYDEPSDMKLALVDLGVPPERIVCDYAGFRTLDSVLRAERVFGQDSFIVVSQRFHALRAVFLARCRGIQAYGYCASDPVLSRRALLRNTVRERFARVAALLDTVFRRGAKFYGPREPLPVEEVPSPNFSERTLPVSLVVIHYTAIPTVERSLVALTNPTNDAPVSAHYLIGEDGRTYHLVDESKRAWHAGKSFWHGIDDVNSASVGIELVNAGLGENGVYSPFPAAQIDSLVLLCTELKTAYSNLVFVGHSDVAPKRKLDPGPAFPWMTLARRGIGVWTDDFSKPKMSVQSMLKTIGYDTTDEKLALKAFERHFYPEALTDKSARVNERLAAVCKLFPAPPPTQPAPPPPPATGVPPTP